MPKINLQEELTKLAHENPALRKHLIPLLKKSRVDLWTDRKRTPAGKPYPKSKYDKMQQFYRPFDWSTPAPVGDHYPEPWRVAHADRLLNFLQRQFPQFKDLYTDYESDLYKGRQQIRIGLRDNRDSKKHKARMNEIATFYRDNLKLPIRWNPKRGYLYLVDDIPKDVLSRTAAVKDWKVKFPSITHTELDKIYTKLNRYYNEVVRAARRDPDLQGHARLLKTALESFITTESRLHRAEEALYY